MAYDAAMMRAVLHDLSVHTAAGARVEKIYQPSKDEVVLILKAGRENLRLLVHIGNAAARLSLTGHTPENPAVCPMFCMLLRKHLTGAKLLGAEQMGFERAARLRFSGYDEMGFATEKSLIAEIMGKYSNLLLLDGKDRILSALRTVDFTTSRLRQVLPGMQYELPPPQDRKPPLSETAEGFLASLAAARGRSIEKFITSTYLGTASVVGRQIAYLATGHADAMVEDVDPQVLCDTFLSWFSDVREHRYTPSLVRDREGMPVAYGYAPITFYEERGTTVQCESFTQLFDAYYGERDRMERIRRRGADLLQLIGHAKARLEKKISLQREELAACGQGEEYRAKGDLITANLWQLRRGDTRLTAVDYTLPDPREVTVELDGRLTPAANAQHFYKLYAKSKTARTELTRQIALAEQELEYLEGVGGFLERAQGEADLNEIRDELYRAGYASRMKQYTPQKKASTGHPLLFRSPGGYTVLVGRNNTQNDNLTFRIADKGDLWFHAKGVPGSHVILQCAGAEPPAEDYTYAAALAARYSQATGSRIAVDYTRVRIVKKPPGAKPGYVTYRTNYTAFVTPDEILGKEGMPHAGA